MPHALFVFALALLPLGPPIPSSSLAGRSGDRAERPLIDLLPRDCLAYVDATGLEGVVAGGLSDPVLASVLTTDVGRHWVRHPQASPARLLGALEQALGSEPLGTVHALVDAGLVLGWCGPLREAIVIGRGTSGESTSAALATALAALGRSHGFPGAFDSPHDHWGDARVWQVGELTLVSFDSLWILGQGQERVRQCLERCRSAAPEPANRPRSSPFPEAARGVRRISSWLDLEALAASGAPGLLDLRRGASSPAFHFLLGEGLATLIDSRQAWIDLDLCPTGVSLAIRGTGIESRGARGQGVVPPALQSPSDLGSALIHRDLAALVARRVELFPASSLPAFAEGLGNVALLFGGRDVEREVLPDLSPWLRLIARQPEYDALRTPAVELPGLALVLPVNSGAIGEDWMAAFQTLIAFLNLDGARKGRPSMRLGLEIREGVTITTARLPDPPEGEDADIRYNLEPAAATKQGLVFLSTHASIVRDLLGRLSATPSEALPPGETAQVRVSAIADLVERNQGLLEQRKRLEEGCSADRAHAEIQLLREWLASVDSARLSLGTPEAPEIRLDIDWSTPSRGGR